jgi:hypothetical protein
MADSPFSNPTIHASIAADVSRIQSTWLEWNAESTTGDFHTTWIMHELSTHSAIDSVN